MGWLGARTCTTAAVSLAFMLERADERLLSAVYTPLGQALRASPAQLGHVDHVARSCTGKEGPVTCRKESRDTKATSVVLDVVFASSVVPRYSTVQKDNKTRCLRVCAGPGIALERFSGGLGNQSRLHRLRGHAALGSYDSCHWCLKDAA